MNSLTEIPTSRRSQVTQEMDTFDARDLIKDGVQACILLDDQTYYLRITKAGKLILTK